MEKIKIPQCLVSYAGGSGGEWLAIQIGQHEKYYHPELTGNRNELNRWRMKGSWRAYLLDHTDIKEKLWTEQDYNNSPEWWDYFWNNAPDKELCYAQVKDIINSKPQYTIPVHRCHEAWYDVYWRDLFEDFKIVTIRVDDTNERVFRQFQGNVIKKIFWQDLDADKLEHELRDKCKKHRVDYDACMYYIGRFMDTVNYTDMMLGVHLIDKKSDYLAAVDATVEILASRWNDYNIKQHHYPIEGGHVVDFGRMFVDKDYNEYVKLCEYLDITPWYADQWDATISEYADEDMQQVITVEDVKERLWKRISEII